MTVRRQLLVLSIGIAVPLVLAGSAALALLWGEMKRELGISLEQQTLLAAATLEHWIDAQRQPLRTIAEFAADGKTLPIDYMNYMVAMRHHWIDLRVVDARGAEIAAVPAGAPYISETVVEGFLARDVARQGTVWSEADRALVVGMPVETGGAVLSRVRMSDMRDIFAEVELADGAVISVHDATGAVVTRSDRAGAAGTDGLNGAALLEALGSRRTALVETQSSPDGVARVHGIARAERANYVVQISVPSEALYASARRQFAGYAVYSLLALLAATLAAIFIARRIERPVRRLSEVAHRLGGGETSVRAEVHGHGEVAELSTAFNLMAERVEEREARLREINERKSEVVSGVSHELRTPLTTIKTLASLLRRDDLPEAERRECLDIIVMECERQIDLVMNLLDLSRIEAGGSSYTRGQVDVSALLRVCLRVEQHVATARGQNLRGRIPTALPPISTDRKAMRRVLCMLIENAIKYTPDGGTITVSAKEDDGGVTVTVSDTGPGIDPEDMPHLFEKFFRGKSRSSSSASRGRVPGVGLGLHLARSVVEDLGGRISVESAPGEGSAFSVWLPRWHEGEAEHRGDLVGAYGEANTGRR
jgi:signal transduction histidine kinase